MPDGIESAEYFYTIRRAVRGIRFLLDICPAAPSATSAPPRVSDAVTVKRKSKSKVNAVLRSNMLSAWLVAGIVKASFGPRGLDKAFTDEIGQVHATSDGAEILVKAKSGHPIARIITEMGKAVDHEVGDGTISAVVLMSAAT